MPDDLTKLRAAAHAVEPLPWNIEDADIRGANDAFVAVDVDVPHSALAYLVAAANACADLERRVVEAEREAVVRIEMETLAAGERDRARRALTRIAALMACEPEDDADLVEATRLLVEERDAARAELERVTRDRDSYANSGFEAQLSAALADVERLRGLLSDAVDLAAEGIGYTPEFFATKWALPERLATIKREGGLTDE